MHVYIYTHIFFEHDQGCNPLHGPCDLQPYGVQGATCVDLRGKPGCPGIPPAKEPLTSSQAPARPPFLPGPDQLQLPDNLPIAMCEQLSP